MTKKIIVSLIITIFLFKTLPINAQMETSESVLYNNVGNVEKVYPLNNYHLLVYFDKTILKSSNNSIVISGEYISHTASNNKVFILYKKADKYNICMIDNLNLTQTIQLRDTIKPSMIKIENNSLVLLGEDDDFGYLSFYNYNLELMNEFFYAEDNGLKSVDVYNIENKWYLFCEKNSHSPNGFFENIGSDKEKKVCILILNNQFTIEKVRYLNCDDGIELLEKAYLRDNQFYFIIKGESKYHYLKSDLNFTTPILLNSEVNTEKEIILNYNNEFLRFNTNNNLIMYYDNISIDISNELVKGIFIEDGLLKYVYLKNNNLYLNEVSEYHIEHLNPFHIDYFEGSLEKNQNLNNSENIQISSYFGEVEVFLNSDIDYRISGSYDVSLIVRRKGTQDIVLTNQLVVHDYCNIFDGGVYPTGLQLKFMGKGYLNGTQITNGHQIDQEGSYTFEIKNNKDESKVYNFQIINNYYNRNEINEKYDYYVNPNEYLTINVNLSSDELVKELWVNEKQVSFTQHNSTLSFDVQGSNNEGINEYEVNKIVYDDREVEYKKVFKVYTTKSLPSLSIQEMESEYPLLVVNVNDIDNSLLKMEINYKTNNQEVSEYYYFNDQEFINSDLVGKTTDLKITLYYTDGIGNIYKQNLLEFLGEFKKENLFKIETIKNSNKIETIKIVFNKIQKLEKLNVINESIKDNYNYTFTYTSLIVSGCLSLVIIGIVMFIVIKRIKRKNKADEKEAIVE